MTAPALETKPTPSAPPSLLFFSRLNLSEGKKGEGGGQAEAECASSVCPLRI